MNVPERFIGYAFSVGDLLVEVDQTFTILHADGASQAILGVTTAALVGENLLDRLAIGDQELVRRTTDSLVGKRRLGPVQIEVRTTSGKHEKLAFFVSKLPTSESSFYFVFSQPFRLGLPRDKATDDQPIAAKKDAFFDRLETLLTDEGGADDDLAVTVLEAIGGNAIDDLERQKVERYLKSFSVGGSLATSLGEGKFAVVHDQSAEEAKDDIGAQVTAAVGLEMNAASIKAQEADLSDTDGVKALAFSLRRFADESDGFGLEKFSNPKDLMGETTERVRQFRTILDEGSFSLVYQPIVRLKDGKTHHFEALSRFEVDNLPYSQFEMICFAEDIGLIQEFDHAVISRVVKRLRQLQTDRVNVKMAANVSGRSLSSRSFMDNLIMILGGAEDLTDNLSLEITESAKITDLDTLAKVLEQIRAMGFKVYLDDFGAGVSGFQYLRQLQVDALKIDGMYIREATENRKDRAFLRSMVSLCRDLGIETVGEWVETSAHANLLDEIGVDYGQGYYFGKPSPGLKMSSS